MKKEVVVNRSGLEIPLSPEQIDALERIARDNHSTLSALVSLAVDALLSEAGQNDGWLLLPQRQRAE